MNLVIVESPTKAKTIASFLPKNFVVLSSYGHIRDLPKSEMGIDLSRNFEPRYIIPAKARSKVKPLREALKKSQHLILATDEDREGEAIAWHLLFILSPEGTLDYQRIVFHEITKEAILRAIKKPRLLNMDLVNAQQARRILDRLVGYSLSPFLWKKIGKGLSAGRVQSAAVRLIAEREEAIKAFSPLEYWSLEALFITNGKKFSAFLQKEAAKSKTEMEKILLDIKDAKFFVASLSTQKTNRYPLPPLTTSTMQQAAAQRLGYPARKTMSLAQGLYEKGLITYHRTDSLNLATSFLDQAKLYLEKKYGAGAVETKKYKSRSKNAQEAHEAIRPTNPEKLVSGPQAKLYELIWQRALASQMKPIVVEERVIDIAVQGKKNKYLFRANGQTVVFPGFLKIYPLKISEQLLPELKTDQVLDLKKLLPNQHFTKAPSRYNEASLIKELEKRGIGRPSTYAPTIFTIQQRNYVEKEAGRFVPQDIGISVNNLLVEHFPEVVDIGFTAKMEDSLDEIARGEKAWVPIIKDFWEPFKKNLDLKFATVEKRLEKTSEKCEKCGEVMLIKIGRFGKFMACSGFPDCRNAKPILQKTGEICPECKNGELILRRARQSGRKFWGCEKYPECKYATWQDPTKPAPKNKKAETSS